MGKNKEAPPAPEIHSIDQDDTKEPGPEPDSMSFGQALAAAKKEVADRLKRSQEEAAETALKLQATLKDAETRLEAEESAKRDASAHKKRRKNRRVQELQQEEDGTSSVKRSIESAFFGSSPAAGGQPEKKKGKKPTD